MAKPLRGYVGRGSFVVAKGFLSSQDLEEINAVIRGYYYSLPTYYINENNLIKLIKNDKNVLVTIQTLLY